MTHLKTPCAQKRFIIDKLKSASPQQIKKIYRETEKIMKFKRKG